MHWSGSLPNTSTYNFASGLNTNSNHTVKIRGYIEGSGSLANRSRSKSSGRTSDNGEDSSGLHGGNYLFDHKESNEAKRTRTPKVKSCLKLSRTGRNFSRSVEKYVERGGLRHKRYLQPTANTNFDENCGQNTMIK